MDNPIRVLMVDDNPFDRALVRESLQDSSCEFELFETPNQEQFKLALSNTPIDVVVTDYNILSNNGLEISDFVLSNFPQIPVVMLTGTGSEEVAVEALKKGLSDYVIKTTEHIQRLPITIQKALAVEHIKREKEEAIKKEMMAKEFWERTFDTIPDAISVLNVEMRVLKTNHAVAELFPGPDPLGKICHEVFHGSGAPCLECPVAQTIQDRKDHDAVIYHEQFDKTFHVSSSLMMNPETNEEVIVYVAKDITEKKKLELLLNQKHKMEAIGRLAGGMAHNFNNLLAVILGNLELAKLKLASSKEELPIKKLEEMLDHGRIAALRARDLIDQIMVYSRIGNERKEPVQIAGVLDETVKLLRSILPSTISLTFSKASDTEYLVVEVSGTQLQEALLNLCSNARDAMAEKGTLDIHIDKKELNAADMLPQYECQPGNFVRITISDTGCGIPQSALDKIFDPFFTTKKVGEGTGMGLSTVQGMLVKHGGLIKVDSELGKGSTFYLYLPCRLWRERPEGTKESPLKRGNEKILLVDDREELCAVAQRMLEELGYAVTAVTGSKEALELFKREPEAYDLIMTDQTMPEMTGEELALEALKIRPGIPIVICTGYSSKLDRDKAKKIGIKSFLMKPYDISNLSKELESTLNGNG